MRLALILLASVIVLLIGLAGWGVYSATGHSPRVSSQQAD